MRRTKTISQLQYLENYRLLFVNLNEVPGLKTELAEYGYDDIKIQEGKDLYTKTQKIYDQKKQETAEEKEAYAYFTEAYDQLRKIYKKHRKIAKVALINKPELWETLAIAGKQASAYLKNMEEIKIFYEKAQTHTEAKPLLEKFKLGKAVVDEQKEKIKEVETLKAIYEKEKAKSQDATKQKNKAFAELSEWVRQFYAVAEIALDDHPQLLESLGKFVRS